MKLAVLVAAAAQAKSSSWLKKEWEVQDAYFADEEIFLSDLSIRDGLRRKYRIYYNIVWSILYYPYNMFHFSDRHLQVNMKF